MTLIEKEIPFRTKLRLMWVFGRTWCGLARFVRKNVSLHEFWLRSQCPWECDEAPPGKPQSG
ncbi:hypothetical protein GCM10010470_36580 [Saccharopolyspora taberi]|uniref:Uncharacterized protein n=1 Tax=Saccharopolyspora taberi TaxID=60895 RepID=A0ABN3VFQ6_9PSEU